MKWRGSVANTELVMPRPVKRAKAKARQKGKFYNQRKAARASARSNIKSAKGVKGKARAAKSGYRSTQKVRDTQVNTKKQYTSTGKVKKLRGKGYRTNLKHTGKVGAAVGPRGATLTNVSPLARTVGQGGAALGAIKGYQASGKKGALAGAAGGAAIGGATGYASGKVGRASRLRKINNSKKTSYAASKSPTYKRKLKNGKTITVKKGRRAKRKR